MKFISKHRDYLPYITAPFVGVSLPRNEPFRPLLDGGLWDVMGLWAVGGLLLLALLVGSYFIYTTFGLTASSSRDGEFEMRQVSEIVCVTVLAIVFFVWLCGGTIPKML